RDPPDPSSSFLCENILPGRSVAPAQPLTAVLGKCGDYASYLNESETRVRNAVTFPSSTFMSILVTSAIRRSRSDFAAVLTACLPASSHDTSLTPTTSTIL